MGDYLTVDSNSPRVSASCQRVSAFESGPGWQAPSPVCGCGQHFLCPAQGGHGPPRCRCIPRPAGLWGACPPSRSLRHWTPEVLKGQAHQPHPCTGNRLVSPGLRATGNLGAELEHSRGEQVPPPTSPRRETWPVTWACTGSSHGRGGVVGRGSGLPGSTPGPSPALGMLAVGTACAACPTHRADLCRAATPPSPAPAFPRHAPPGPSRVFSRSCTRSQEHQLHPGEFAWRAGHQHVRGGSQRVLQESRPRSGGLRCGPDSRHVPAGGDSQQRARRPFHPSSRLPAWTALPPRVPAAAAGPRAGPAPLPSGHGQARWLLRNKPAGPMPALVLHPSAHGAGGWSGSWAVGGAPGRQPGAGWATRPAASAGRAWVPQSRPLAPVVRGQHTGARGGFPRHVCGRVHATAAVLWPLVLATSRRQDRGSQPVPRDEDWGGSEWVTGERPAAAGQARTATRGSRGASSLWPRRAPSPQRAARTRSSRLDPPPAGRRRGWPLPREQVRVPSQPRRDPAGSRRPWPRRLPGSRPAPPPHVAGTVVGPSVASGAAPQLTSLGPPPGAASAARCCCEDPETQRPTAAAVWSPAGGGRLCSSLLGTRVAALAGLATAQASPQGAFLPGGPRRHAHLQARACHRGCPTHRRPDLTRTAPRRDGAGPPGSVWARGREASPAPGSQQHAGCRHGARGFPLRLRARGGARPQLRCVLTPPAALPAQERFRGSAEPQVQRGGRLHPSPWVGPGGGHRIGCWPRAEARPGRRRASAGPASGSLFNLNVSWKAARWARVPGCAHRARDALGPDSQRWPRSGGPLALADRLDAAASRQARGVAGSLESGRWLCSATSRLPGGPSAAGHLPASQRGPRRQEGEGASVGPARCPGGSAFRAPREETQRMCRSGSRWHGTFQTLKCFNRRHPEPCPAVPSAATLTRPGHGPSWCWRGPGQRSSHPKHGAIH